MTTYLRAGVQRRLHVVAEDNLEKLLGVVVDTLEAATGLSF